MITAGKVITRIRFATVYNTMLFRDISLLTDVSTVAIPVKAFSRHLSLPTTGLGSFKCTT